MCCFYDDIAGRVEALKTASLSLNMNSLALTVLLSLMTVTAWAGTKGEVDGIPYDKDCMAGCMKLHVKCQKFCEGAINDDCKNLCKSNAIHCTMLCIDVDVEYPSIEA
ncbi:hypothetical protein LSAT2_004987 [Lamellibrachia satsuma]|nr:hypothetical protein LSAT2_004987 [Lamellibrachia satsuma]